MGQFFEGVEAQTCLGGQDDNKSGYFPSLRHIEEQLTTLFGRRARLDPEPADVLQHQLSVPMPILGVDGNCGF